MGEGRDGDCVEAVVGDVKEEAEDERQEGKKSKEKRKRRGKREWSCVSFFRDNFNL